MLKKFRMHIRLYSAMRTIGTTATLALAVVAVMLVAPVSGGSELVEAAAGTANPSILTYTATNSVASVSLIVASPSGTFATSTEEQKAAFSIATNNATGYTLSAKMTGSAGLELYNVNDSNVSIANLPSAASSGITAAEFDTATYNNMWG